MPPLSGAADMVSAVFRATVWNQTIPDTMRGRLAGIEMLSYSVGPMVGETRAGFVADAWSVRGAIVSGGSFAIDPVTGRGTAEIGVSVASTSPLEGLYTFRFSVTARPEIAPVESAAYVP